MQIKSNINKVAHFATALFLIPLLILAGCGGGGGGGGASAGGGAIAPAKAITSFSIVNPAVVGTINESAKTITLTVPSGTNLGALVPTFTTTGTSVTVGSTVQASGTTSNNFASPVIYTVKAADNTTTQYTVTVTVAGVGTKAITSFSILGIAGVVNETAKTISVTLPSNTVVTARTAIFTTTGASVTVGTTVQVSGTTANNFTAPVIYKVTAANGTSTQYTVTVTLSGGLYIALQSNSVTVDLPSVITFFFQAKDISGNYVTTLANPDFTILEDNLPLTPAESFQELVPISQLPYTLQTVLLIDISSSITAADLVNMKVAAKNMVANMVPHQQIAVYTFDDRFTQVAAFTNNTTTLNTAIDSIVIGNPSTNLYGAIQQGVALWTDTATATGITKGFLVAITDGADTAGISTLSAALTARGSKSVYTIGAGANADAVALTSIGNAGYLPITNYSLLQNALNQVTADVAATAASFYFMHYSTPKRAGTHTLTLQVAGNTNTSANGTIASSFSAAGFSSITPLTRFTITPTNLALGTATQLVATGTLASAATVNLASTSIWNSSDPTIATISATGLATALTNGTFTINATAPAVNMFKFATATVTVSDPPPTVPANLVATPAGSLVDLSWSASTDNIAVAGYKIYRGGVLINTVTSTSFRDTGLTPLTNYCYAVSAYDTSNNESAQSTQICTATTALHQFAYSANGNATISVFTVDPITGALTAGSSVAGDSHDLNGCSSIW